jgi:CRISPR-associated protein Cas2
MKSWHLISYDVRDPKRLRLVARKLEAYGTRVQYSIFRCRLTRESLEKLRWELAEILDQADSLLVIRPPTPAGVEHTKTSSRFRRALS